jgi:hypothetical protein
LKIRENSRKYPKFFGTHKKPANSSEILIPNHVWDMLGSINFLYSIKNSGKTLKKKIFI